LYLPFGADGSTTTKKKIKLLLSINLSKYHPFKENLYLPLGADCSTTAKK
jgi:hypothetical protein